MTTSEANDQRSLTVESELLLDAAAGFARGGDYLGALARARFAERRLSQAAESLAADDADVVAIRAHLDLRIRHYESLVRQWQMQVEARHAAYTGREQRAIGNILRS